MNRSLTNMAAGVILLACAGGAGAQQPAGAAGACPAVQSGGSVYDRYDQAVARRQCLERRAQSLIAVVSAPPPASTEDNVLEFARTSKQNAAAEVPQADAAAKDAKDEEQKLWAEKSFLGFNWAAGLGYTFGRGAPRITDASVVNGVVRVKEDSTDQAVALLEIHHMFEIPSARNVFGWGPFASAQTGSGDSVVSFGVGLEFGWHDRDPKSSGGFLLGIGYSWNPKSKTLGDGIVANEPLPVGETEVRYKTNSAGSLLIFVSRRFDMSGPPSN